MTVEITDNRKGWVLTTIRSRMVWDLGKELTVLTVNGNIFLREREKEENIYI